MKGLFSPDSKLMQILGYLVDLFILNILFIVSCLPVVTVGAAATALYTVCFRINTEREGSVFMDYWRAFRDNFRQSTAIWLILLVLLVVSVVDLYAATAESPFYQLRPLFWLFLIVTGCVYSMVFPTLSQFSGTVGLTMKNALLLALAHLPKVLLLTLMNFLPLLVLAVDAGLFLNLCVLFFTVYFSGAAMLGRVLLKGVYKVHQKSESPEPQE